jgi:hypothetical protein
VVLLTRREADVTGGRHQSEAGPPKIAPRGGRLQIGTVADFKSEWWTGFRPEGWPTSNRKGWPACVGICTVDGVSDAAQANVARRGGRQDDVMG